MLMSSLYTVNQKLKIILKIKNHQNIAEIDRSPCTLQYTHMNQTPEKLVMKAIEQLIAAKYRKYVVLWRNNTGMVKYEDKYGKKRGVRYGAVGSSDFIGCIAPSGRLLCIEAKAGKGKMTENQKAFRDRIESVGGLYILAYSAEDVDKVLSSIVTT